MTWSLFSCRVKSKAGVRLLGVEQSNPLKWNVTQVAQRSSRRGSVIASKLTDPAYHSNRWVDL